MKINLSKTITSKITKINKTKNNKNKTKIFAFPTRYTCLEKGTNLHVLFVPKNNNNTDFIQWYISK